MSALRTGRYSSPDGVVTGRAGEFPGVFRGVPLNPAAGGFGHSLAKCPVPPQRKHASFRLLGDWARPRPPGEGLLALLGFGQYVRTWPIFSQLKQMTFRRRHSSACVVPGQPTSWHWGHGLVVACAGSACAARIGLPSWYRKTCASESKACRRACRRLFGLANAVRLFT